MVKDPLNRRIIEMEGAPYPDFDAATYINQDLWLQFLQGKIDLKMIRCVSWSRSTDIVATPEELYAISPDYYNDRKFCYGMGKNEVTDNTLYIPSPDHYIPLVHGGPKTIDNLRIVPRQFNIWKRDMLKEDWVKFKEFMEGHMQS